jgi:peptidoglycan/LPS O-acetylase OafA/YrhL
VDLFFVLSGFLVTRPLFDDIAVDQGARVGRFLFRRWTKIYPPYIVLLLATFLITGRFPSLSEGAKYLSLTQNYLGFDDVLLHTWSLAVEEQFYVGVAILFFALSLNHRLRSTIRLAFPAFWACVAVLALTSRIDYSNSHEYVWSKQMTFTHFRVDSLAFGALIAWAYRFRPEVFAMNRTLRAVVAPAGILLMSPAAVFDVNGAGMHTYGFTLMYVGAGLLVIAALTSEPNRPNRATTGFANWFGRPSYSIYLWHVLLSAFLSPYLISTGMASIGADLLFLAASVVFGNLMFELLEKPAVRFARGVWTKPGNRLALIRDYSKRTA